MIPDLSPLFHIVFFAAGFVPAIVVASVASIFLPVPLWGGLLGAALVGLAVAFYFSRAA